MTNLKSFLTDTANAIRKKTGTTGKIKATEFDSKINGITTKINIDGIIEGYKISSDGRISAGDFVKFINEYRNKNN